MAISPESSMKLLEDASHVSPPPSSVPTTTLPLTFSDRIFLGFPGSWMQYLFFYYFQYPTSHFMETTLPKLKASLSLTLQHFFPFAGNLVFPPLPQMPYILYTEGDSVSFIVYESSEDFNHFIGDHARHAQDFQPLFPKSPPEVESKSSGCTQKPNMAIQVAVFPDVGISIGVGFSHVLGDGRTDAHFMKSWAAIHKSQGDLTCFTNCFPTFDRDLVNDPSGRASGLFMKNERVFQGSSSTSSVFFNNVRVTCKIKRSQVELLKSWVKKTCMEVYGSEPIRMSTFVVTCAYTWVCLTKLQQIGTHQNPSPDDFDAVSYFHFPVDCRGHLKLPETYFGNCVLLRMTAAKKSELLGENGILVAATVIGREIMEFQEQPFKDAETSWAKVVEIIKMIKDSIFVTSSPKFGVYTSDFGWGRPKKIEFGNIASFGSVSSFSISENSEEEGGVEFGIALPPHESDSFNTIFHRGLLKLS
ncbi:coumaroyl-CoA:anthocyanidin 3-O-glucoside-6''-O-coumaroyltransferase 1-like [Hibiscus syriacus]|nr:coumaroyl-CoA:anthocyanidin 3-O-glucoside-6''-O-coumaroyltransferase 1-like [Hibiscus syriacus]